MGVFRRPWLTAVALSSVVVATACNPPASAKTATAAPNGNGSDRVNGVGPGTAADSLSQRMDRARILGDPSARVWLIMLSDFQCPYCKQFHDQSFTALQQQYVATGKVRLAYINYPLPIHMNAWPAAETAMCAGLQGKFWQMHDALFAAQSVWAEQKTAQPILDSIAHTIGIDTTSLNRCVTTHQARPLIQADVERAQTAWENANVQIGTPTIIIGASLWPGVRPTDFYRHALDSALAVGK
jgi:protein-disulfide isomerase